MSDDHGFRYLNLENAWLHPTLDGVVTRADGALTLARVPRADATIGEPFPPVEALAGPAGIGVDGEGNLYIADPANHRILRADACSGETVPLLCFGGVGRLPGQLQTPRGVLVGPRGALYVADSGNHRVQVVDLRTLQLRGIWGQLDPYAEPEASAVPGRFNEPWDLAADQDGHLYVVDHGNRRVQQFDTDGRVIRSFWETMRTQPVVPQEPTYIATALLDDGERLLVLDQARPTLLVYQTSGAYDEVATPRWKTPPLAQPAGVAFTEDTLYIGDATGRRVLVFDRQGRCMGVAQGYRGPVAGLSLDRRGRLLIVHPGGDGTVTQLSLDQAFMETGSFLIGPLEVSKQPTHWHRLQVQADPLPEGTHVRFFTYTSGEDSSPLWSPDQLAHTLEHQLLAPAETWRAAPPDSCDLLVLNEPARYLWIGGTLQGNGTDSPALHQIRLEYDHETWLRYLPALYSRNETDRAFLACALALFESLLGRAESLIDDLPLLFDAQTASNNDAPHSHLDWLAGWLAFELDEAWGENERREALAGAFALYGRRGTVEGLQRFIELYAGTRARIEEPARFASLWSLGETSTLGFDTMLVSAHAQGAVVGTTATLDHSHLIDERDYGAPLFEDLAHHFCVQVYAAELARPDVMEQVRQVIDREKPAHTTYHLCLIEARLRVGFQARVGIDTIVGGPLPDLVLDEPRHLGLDTVLPGAPDGRPAGGTIGHDAHVGRRTILT